MTDNKQENEENLDSEFKGKDYAPAFAICYSIALIIGYIGGVVIPESFLAPIGMVFIWPAAIFMKLYLMAMIFGLFFFIGMVYVIIYHVPQKIMQVHSDMHYSGLEGGEKLQVYAIRLFVWVYLLTCTIATIFAIVEYGNQQG